MRRILVPLDGTDRSAAILADAKRLAGPGGTLVLVRDVSASAIDIERGAEGEYTEVEAVEIYLSGVAQNLRGEGYTVLTQLFVMNGANAAIEEATRLFKPDMVACATHAGTGVSRLLHGSVAWQALNHSPVPMLLRHPYGETLPAEPSARFILVPLDGSPLAESALPLAEQLALEWDAELCLARVVPWPAGVYPVGHADDIREAKDSLESIPAYRQQATPGHVRSVSMVVLSGSPIDTLAWLVQDRGITDVVLASHGRTGLARIAVGSVTDGLIHRLHCPIIVVPTRAAIGEIRRPLVGDTVLAR